MVTQWWVYVVFVTIVFIILVILHCIVKKFNEGRIEERFCRLYGKTSASTQCNNTPFIDMELNNTKEGKSWKREDSKDGISLIFTKEDNKKRNLAYTWNSETEQSWAMSKGIAFHSLEDMENIESDTITLRPHSNTMNESVFSNSLTLTPSDPNARRLIGSRFMNYDHLNTRNDQKYSKDIQSLLKVSKESGIACQYNMDDYQILEGVENPFGKFLGAIYCNVSVNSKDALVNPYVKASHSSAIISNLDSARPNYQTVDGLLSKMTRNVLDSDTSNDQYAKTINKEGDLVENIKKTTSKVTFKEVVTALSAPDTDTSEEALTLDVDKDKLSFNRTLSLEKVNIKNKTVLDQHFEDGEKQTLKETGTLKLQVLNNVATTSKVDDNTINNNLYDVRDEIVQLKTSPLGNVASKNNMDLNKDETRIEANIEDTNEIKPNLISKETIESEPNNKDSQKLKLCAVESFNCEKKLLDEIIKNLSVMELPKQADDEDKSSKSTENETND